MVYLNVPKKIAVMLNREVPQTILGSMITKIKLREKSWRTPRDIVAMFSKELFYAIKEDPRSIAIYRQFFAAYPELHREAEEEYKVMVESIFDSDY